MKQLDLFDGLNGIQESDFGVAKIYESPDGGVTVYARDFGADPSARVLIKAPSEPQWTISYKVQE